MELTLAEAAERLHVTPRRVRALVEREQLPAVRRGRMWLTTDAAVDEFRRNSPGQGRPIASTTAWARLRELAADGDLPSLRDARPALRSRAVHRRYALPDLMAQRLGTPTGTFRSGLEVVGLGRSGQPVDLYATAEAAHRLVRGSGATPAGDGGLCLHVVDPTAGLPELSAREALVLAWCDLADRADAGADVAAERLWPGSVGIPTLADIAHGHEGETFVAIRGFIDWLVRHPLLVTDAIAERPCPSGDVALDSLLAAIAETVADDAGV